jgi:hypothetical protein
MPKMVFPSVDLVPAAGEELYRRSNHKSMRQASPNPPVGRPADSIGISSQDYQYVFRMIPIRLIWAGEERWSFCRA